jgi:PASTA domain./Protein kinase domain.
MTNRCMSCFSEIGNESVCPGCGFIRGTENLKGYLPLGTVLGERYVIGKLLSYNSEGATYVALDKDLERPIEIREYFPEDVAARGIDEKSVTILPGEDATYKALMSEFQELHRKLMQFRRFEPIGAVYDTFYENGTVYAVQEHILGMTLGEYLAQNAGELSTRETVRLITPLLHALDTVHTENIFHRGISPSTVYIDTRGRLKLVGFSISSLRCEGSTLSPEIFGGYAAPEQYSAGAFHGAWTDVYGCAALVYKMLTGTAVPTANTRVNKDNLVAANVLVPSVGISVSKLLMSALVVSTSQRIQSLKDFSSRLSLADRDITTAAPIPQEDEKKKLKPAHKFLVVLGSVILGILIFVGGTYALIWWANDRPDNGYSDFSIDTSIEYYSVGSEDPMKENEFAVPKLKGENFSIAQERYAKKIKIVESEQQFSDTVPRGCIISCEFEENTPVEVGSEVKCIVSKGPRYPLIPDYAGKKEGAYLLELDRLGIKYVKHYQEVFYSEDGSLEAGSIISVSVEVGKPFDAELGELDVVIAGEPTAEE